MLLIRTLINCITLGFFFIIYNSQCHGCYFFEIYKYNKDWKLAKFTILVN